MTENRSLTRGERETKECRTCGKVMSVRVSQIRSGRGQFCSRTCIQKYTRTAESRERQGRTPTLWYDEDGPAYGVIPLTHGLSAIVDPCDFAEISQHNWTAKVKKYTAYAVRVEVVDGRDVRYRMHRVITGAPAGFEVDHKNGNGLDNRRENLRICAPFQNRCNRGLQCNNTSGAKGVSWFEDTKSWRARIKVHSKEVHLGLYKDKHDAIEAYNRAVIRLHGEFAVLNTEAPSAPSDTALTGGSADSVAGEQW